MRLKIVICCFVLLALINLTKANNFLEFAKTIADKNRERLQKMRDNLKEIFQPTTDTNQSLTNETDIGIFFLNNRQNSTIKTTENTIVSTTTSATVKTNDSSNQNKDTVVFPNEENANQTSSKGVEDTTKQEGREIFEGNCETGYKRTVDGRCMPTY